MSDSDSAFVLHAKRELDIIGLTEDSTDEMNVMMRNHLLHMCRQFAEEGHSGFSAAYAAKCLDKLFRYEPLSPLLGDDSEWNDVSDMAGPGGGKLYQNNRCSRVFKDDEGAYDIEGKIFYDVLLDDDGQEYRSYYSCRGSRVYVTFPYTPTKEYLPRPAEEDAK